MSSHISNLAELQYEVDPFYFGTSPQRLYGCHHRPRAAHDKSNAIILCPAIGQEYLQSHRVFYQLAVLLSRAGFHVLRFDYFGCGDSEGEYERGSIVKWTENIRTAIAEIKCRSRQKKVCLIGLRMGATLAVQAASDCDQVAGIILWEPIVRGNRYLQELEEAHRDYLYEWRHQITQTNDMKSSMSQEILGFPLTSGMRREIEAINTENIKLPAFAKVLIISNSNETSHVCDMSRITERQSHAEMRVIADQSKVWKEFYRKINPHKTLLYIVEWIESIQV